MKKKHFTSAEMIAFINEVWRVHPYDKNVPLLLNLGSRESGQIQKFSMYRFEGIFQPSRTTEHFTFKETKDSDLMHQEWKLCCSQGMKEFTDRQTSLAKLLVGKVIEIKRYDQV